MNFHQSNQGSYSHMVTEGGHVRSPVDKRADIGNKENSGVSDCFKVGEMP